MRRELNIIEALFSIEHELIHADECFEQDEKRFGFQCLGNARRTLKAVREALDHVYTLPE